MDGLQNIPIVRQQHPGLSPRQPFNVVWEYCPAPMDKFRGDMHYALQLCIVIHGSMEVLFDNYKREYHPGEAFWTMFWEPHAFRFSGKRNFAIAVNIDIDYLGNCDPFGDCNWLLPFVLSPELRHCPGDDIGKGRFLASGKNLMRLWTRRPLNWRQRAWFAVHELILNALDGLDDSSRSQGMLAFSDGYLRVKPAVDIARAHTGRPPALDEAARLCSLSPSRFSELFKLVFGISFGRFAARARLAGAARDLAISHSAIEDIAAKWGFFDNSHFTNAFRKLYGCTPRQYRQG